MRAIVTQDGILTLGTQHFRAALGRGGVRIDKREGAGLLPLRKLLYRPDRLPAPLCSVPLQAIAPDDGWCDDPQHPAYNQPVRLPIAATAESLWRDDAIYDIIGVLGWNDSPVRPGLGSAIFLHLARPDFAPTEGCIALSEPDLRQILATGLTEILVTIG
jgi:L,D-peptidoglycan transpeptidase YkuD (ErfK/YbiS/YcfS/YnhG family)